MVFFILLIEFLGSLAIAIIGGFCFVNIFEFSSEANRTDDYSFRILVFGCAGVIVLCIPLILAVRTIYQQYTLHSWSVNSHLWMPAIAIIICGILAPIMIVGAEGGLTLELIKEFRAPAIYEQDPVAFKKAMNNKAKSFDWIPNRFVSEIVFGSIPLPSGWYAWRDGNHIFISEDLDRSVALDAETTHADPEASTIIFATSKPTKIGRYEWYLQEAENDRTVKVTFLTFLRNAEANHNKIYKVNICYPVDSPNKRAVLLTIVSGIKIYDDALSLK